MKFTPRLTEPPENNKNYIHYTHGGYNTAIVIDKDTGSVLPNCVGYAQGRLLELIGKNKVDWKLPACNAEDWFETAQKNGFKTGQIPKLGAIAVFRAGTTHNGSDGAGHVVVVEEIKANGDIVVSQSAYGGAKFYTTLLTKESGYKYADDRIFEGFIYCPVEFEQAAETPTPDVIEAGKTITLDNTDCYTSETSTSSYSRKTGTYYLWDDAVKNGRIRITNAPERTGVAGQVTCWVNVKDIFEQAAETPTPDVIEAGKKITLDNTDCYTSETSTSSYSRKTGTYYLWDDVEKNGRIRITNAPERTGVAGQVTCWVNVKDIHQ